MSRSYEVPFGRRHAHVPNGLGGDALYMDRPYPRLPYVDVMPIMPRDDNVRTTSRWMQRPTASRLEWPFMTRVSPARAAATNPVYLFQDVPIPRVTYGSVYYNAQATPDTMTVRDTATDLTGQEPWLRRGGILDP